MTRPDAPGAPGIAPTWSSSDKDFVTASLGRSRLWATVGHGVLNEVYWPSTGRPRLRDMTFYLVSKDGDGAWIDLKRCAAYDLTTPAPAIPLIRIRHAGTQAGRDYALALEVLPDTDRDSLLLTWTIEGPWRLAVIVAPHMDSAACDSVAWVDGELYATGTNGTPAICIAATGGFEMASAGYVGTSDGWQDLDAHGWLTWTHGHAGPGNVALTALCRGVSGQVALAIAETPVGARTLALATLADDTARVREGFCSDWQGWAATLTLPRAATGDAALDVALLEAASISATVLKAHEDRGYPGAHVASLSVPWGASTGTLGGYHLVWPRDTVLTAFAFLALGQRDEARRTLAHLIAVQDADGGWPQNYYPSGQPFWTGVQLDEAALPILLAAKLREMGEAELDGGGAMVRRAVAYVARNGPATPQDRWEENPGVNPFTLATCIAALVAAAPWLEDAARDEALDLADEWRERLDQWFWVERSRWTEAASVPGHWIRLRPPAGSPGGRGTVLLRNRDGETIPAADLVAMDFSYLSRLGIVADDDARLRATVAVVDRALAVLTPSGTLYHRYNEDGYGETAEGGPFVTAGIGRGWPLLVGERGHLALGLGEDAAPYLRTMLACRSPGGLLPEQVWDADPVPDRNLRPGRPSGSAMPLLWAHAEFVKLLAAHAAGRPVERLDAVVARYGPRDRRAAAWRWREETPVETLPADRDLMVEGREPFALRYGLGGWDDPAEFDASLGPLGLWQAGLPADTLRGHTHVAFTRRFGDRWEGVDHSVGLAFGSEPVLQGPGD